MNQLTIEELSIEYQTKKGTISAVDDASFEIAPGEVVGVVGESGSGKSTVAKSIIRILDHNGQISGGKVHFDEFDLTDIPDSTLAKEIRGTRIGMIFQDPHASLSPVSTVGKQLSDMIKQHRDVTKAEAREQAIELLADVGISSPEQRYDVYPDSFSGGMLQRVLLAIAIAGDPELLIADEPTTGLDMTVQAQILSQLETLNQSEEMGILFISHDLDVVRDICDKVVVMYDGQVIEKGECEAVITNPKHPYTTELVTSTLGDVLESGDSEMEPLEEAASSGCPYHHICPESLGEECETGGVPQEYTTEDRTVRCHLYDPQQMTGDD